MRQADVALPFSSGPRGIGTPDGTVWSGCVWGRLGWGRWGWTWRPEVRAETTESHTHINKSYNQTIHSVFIRFLDNVGGKSRASDDAESRSDSCTFWYSRTLSTLQFLKSNVFYDYITLYCLHPCRSIVFLFAKKNDFHGCHHNSMYWRRSILYNLLYSCHPVQVQCFLLSNMWILHH